VRFGLWALLALLLGAFVAHFVLEDRGYVLINFRSYVVEMSVPGLLLVLIGLYLAVRALIGLARSPFWVRNAIRERGLKRGGADLAQALIHMTEGDFARAERLLTRGLASSDAPLLNYVLAARAAQLQNALERRDQWLKLAYDESADGRAAVLLTQAELQLGSNELDAALATLRRLEELRPDHPGALGLLARTYRARDEGAALAALLPRLGRARLAPGEREELATDALEAELSRADLTSERLGELWGQLSSELKAMPEVVALRALALQALGRGEEAEKELRAALKKDWQRAPVLAYGEVRGADLAKQLKQAETWLRKYPEDAALLLTAARLCVASELWGKARSYLESSLAVAPEPDAYALYGRLLAELGEGERAALAFRSGLALASPAAALELKTDSPSLQPPTTPDATEGEANADPPKRSTG
jgi:HemY protein